MDIFVIASLAAGVILIVLGYVLPVKKEETSPRTKELAKEEIASLVAQEMDKIKSHVDDVVGEAIDYAVEKTERSLERISNEKIMAVNEYSDTVLQDIHKNHDEVLFLYDMLNDKHKNLKNTVSEANKTVKEVAQTKQEAEAVVYSFLQMNPETGQATARQPESQPAKQPVPTPVQAAVEPQRTPVEEISPEQITQEETPESRDTQGQNSNEEILALYRQGKSKLAIAKELGLGVGEVKLVIDLYKKLDG